MARYTIELRNVVMIFGREAVESWFKDYNLSDYLTDSEIATITARGVFDKDKLAAQIVDHYWMHEIGYETPALFEHQTKVFMKELMEEKAPIIYSIAITYDPLKNMNYTETYSGQNSNQASANSSSTTNGSGLTVNSDTPQGQISKTAILAGSYASSTGANESTNTVTDSTTNSGSGTDSHTKTISGNNGVTSQKLIEDYRKNIIAINRDIIKAAGNLFMIVY